MKILLLGKNGQVGWELQRSLAPLGEVIALDRQGRDDGLCGNLEDIGGLLATVAKVSPDVIVNAAAYTAVDQAETESERAYAVNALAPAALANAAQKIGAWFIHYSTDYVFDGAGSQPWREADFPAPLNTYGQTKLEGEHAAQFCAKHLIFRTSWVYAARGGNFAKTMLRLASERSTLNVIADQWGAPTGAELIADVTAHAIRAARHHASLSGIYHLAAAGETTWHGYANHVIEYVRARGVAFRVPPDAVCAIPTSSYPTPATRPLNSRLDTTKLQQAFDLWMPSWQRGVNRMLDEILQKM